MKFKRTAILASIMLVAIGGLAFAQGAAHPEPEEPGLTYEEQLSIVLVGVLAGLVTAYQGFSKSGKPFVFRLFLDRTVTAVIASLGIAIASVALGESVTLFTLVLTFLASVGSASLILRNRKITTAT